MSICPRSGEYSQRLTIFGWPASPGVRRPLQSVLHRDHGFILHQEVEPSDYRYSKASSPGRQTIHCLSSKPPSMAISGPTSSSLVGWRRTDPVKKSSLRPTPVASCVADTSWPMSARSASAPAWFRRRDLTLAGYDGRQHITQMLVIAARSI